MAPEPSPSTEPKGRHGMSELPSTNQRDHIAGGIGLRLASVGCYSIMAALLKLASGRGVVAVEMLFYRAIFGLPVVLLWVLFSQGFSALGTRKPLAHLGRCALGIASILCTFQALIMLPLADATAISFMAPAFATILSWLILREHVGRYRWSAILLGFVGVLIVTRPGGAAVEVPIAGVAIALVAAMGTAGVVITLRQLRHTEHVAAIVFWFFVASAMVGASFLPFFGSAHDGRTILLLAAAGAAGGLMQITLTASLQKAPVSVLSPFDYLQIVGAVALGWVLLAEVPTVNTFAGAALIVTSGLYIAWRERRLRRASSGIRVVP
jgi:drug/metabolite transporter (DMT)-like permease